MIGLIDTLLTCSFTKQTETVDMFDDERGRRGHDQATPQSHWAALHPRPYASIMLLKATAALTLLAAAHVWAAPAAAYGEAQPPAQVVLSGARQAALDWSAGALSRIGDAGQAHAMTQWGWSDCGQFPPPPLSCCPACRRCLSRWGAQRSRHQSRYSYRAADTLQAT